MTAYRTASTEWSLPSGISSIQFPSLSRSNSFKANPAKVSGQRLLAVMAGKDVVCVDPDNDLVVPSAMGEAQPILIEGNAFEASVPILKGAVSAMGMPFNVNVVTFQMIYLSFE